MLELEFRKKALTDIQKLAKNPKLRLRLQLILDDIKINPYSTKFKFERLRYNLTGYCSKRLDSKNRIIYQVIENRIVVQIVSVLGHYD